jgi:hypothetical protein
MHEYGTVSECWNSSCLGVAALCSATAAALVLQLPCDMALQHACCSAEAQNRRALVLCTVVWSHLQLAGARLLGMGSC